MRSEAFDPEMERGMAEVKTPTLADAMSHVVDAGERLVSHRLELAVIELRLTIEKLQQTALAGLTASLLAGTGWIFVMLALFWWLESFGSKAVAAAAVGALQLLLALVLVKNRERLFGGSQE